MSTSAKRLRSKHQPTGQWIRSDKRLAIYLRDDFTCQTCGVDLRDAKPADITLDHIKPQSKGGENHEHNLFTSCRSCNCSRQDRALDRFAGRVEAIEIKKQARTSLYHFRELAKAILAGK